MTTLSITGLTKAFGRVPVLRDVSILVPAGTRTAIVGASGSGKSTLLRLIAGFDRADAGEIRLGDRTLAAPGQFVPAHRRGIGYVAQDGALFPHLTVEQNIRFGLPRPGRHTGRVREVMDLTSIDPALIGRYPHQLSGGQQQRVAVARALAPGPRVVLLDEPFSALDTGLREQTRQAVVDALDHSAVTTVLVTHDQDEALSFGHQVGIVDDGRIVQSGPPATVFDNPATLDVATFLGPAVLLPATPSDGYADCALGQIPVRHDHSSGGQPVQALLRPGQLQLTPNSGRPNAVVDKVHPRGSHAEVTIRTIVDGTTQVTLRVPIHQAADYQASMAVSIRVAGGCVLYPLG